MEKVQLKRRVRYFSGENTERMGDSKRRAEEWEDVKRISHQICPFAILLRSNPSAILLPSVLGFHLGSLLLIQESEMLLENLIYIRVLWSSFGSKNEFQ